MSKLFFYYLELLQLLCIREFIRTVYVYCFYTYRVYTHPNAGIS
jgi:hypothetical protein